MQMQTVKPRSMVENIRNSCQRWLKSFSHISATAKYIRLQSKTTLIMHIYFFSFFK